MDGFQHASHGIYGEYQPHTGSEAPKSWAELLDPRWKGKIVMANPEKSGTAYAQVYGVYKMFGDEGLAKLVNNATILDSSSLVYKGTAEGEFPLGITMEYARSAMSRAATRM